MAALKLKKFSMEEASNMSEHKTYYYNTNNLVLRRGQEFKITLHFNRPMQKKEQLEFYFFTGLKPQEAHKTLAVFKLSKSKRSTNWTATTDSRSSSDMNLTITSPANAPIGLYKANLVIHSQNKRSQFQLRDFILLFNPWAKDDVVFLEDEDERYEYVLNDSGIIYYGQKDYIQEMGWNFGQFEEGILSTCLQILNRSLNYQEDKALDCSKRYDPGYVGRVLSAMVNSWEDEGVIEGNWDSRFPGGVDPADWNGSVEILIKWRKGGYKPVKYGQCWVFAGVMCTALRCLGIPTRVVTNFDSAHDKDSNLSIDSIYTSSGRKKTKDSVWNYHVWNESWFRRRDLAKSYGGWQVLDATPQELSGDVHCCGPAPVHAIKEGDIDLAYDCPFIFSEVNADRNTWIYYDKDVKEKVYTNTENVGKNISTKSVGKDERLDITENYKYPEGSAAERAIYLKAREKLVKMGIISKDSISKSSIGKKRRKKRNGELLKDDAEDIKEKLDIEGKFEITSSTRFGEDISLILTLKNTGRSTQNVKVKLSSSSIEYTGKPIVELLSDRKSLTLAPKKGNQIPVTLYASKYEREIINHNLIEVVALCILKSGKKMLIRKVLFIERPPLQIELHSVAFVNSPVEIEVTYTNPLSTILKDGFLAVEGSGLVKRPRKRKVPELAPRETRTVVVEITPFRAGKKQLLLDFTSKHFSSIKGFLSINVKDVNDKAVDEAADPNEAADIDDAVEVDDTADAYDIEDEDMEDEDMEYEDVEEEELDYEDTDEAYEVDETEEESLE